MKLTKSKLREMIKEVISETEAEGYDDPAMKSVAKTLQKMSSDIFVLTDAERFVNYTIPPAAYGTFKNTLLFTKDLVTLEKYPEGSRYEGIKFPRSALQVVPTGESISTLVSKY